MTSSGSSRSGAWARTSLSFRAKADRVNRGGAPLDKAVRQMGAELPSADFTLLETQGREHAARFNSSASV